MSSLSRVHSDNKPTPGEIANCLPHLEAEIAALPRLRIVVALGRIAFDAYLRLLRRSFVTSQRRNRSSTGIDHPGSAGPASAISPRR